jgi:hypothetical protein
MFEERHKQFARRLEEVTPLLLPTLPNITQMLRQFPYKPLEPAKDISNIEPITARAQFFANRLHDIHQQLLLEQPNRIATSDTCAKMLVPFCMELDVWLRSPTQVGALSRYYQEQYQRIGPRLTFPNHHNGMIAFTPIDVDLDRLHKQYHVARFLAARPYAAYRSLLLFTEMVLDLSTHQESSCSMQKLVAYAACITRRRAQMDHLVSVIEPVGDTHCRIPLQSGVFVLATLAEALATTMRHLTNDYLSSIINDALDNKLSHTTAAQKILHAATAPATDDTVLIIDGSQAGTFRLSIAELPKGHLHQSAVMRITRALELAAIELRKQGIKLYTLQEGRDASDSRYEICLSIPTEKPQQPPVSQLATYEAAISDIAAHYRAKQETMPATFWRNHGREISSFTISSSLIHEPTLVTLIELTKKLSDTLRCGNLSYQFEYEADSNTEGSISTDTVLVLCSKRASIGNNGFTGVTHSANFDNHTIAHPLALKSLEYLFSRSTMCHIECTLPQFRKGSAEAIVPIAIDEYRDLMLKFISTVSLECSNVAAPLTISSKPIRDESEDTVSSLVCVIAGRDRHGGEIYTTIRCDALDFTVSVEHSTRSS